MEKVTGTQVGGRWVQGLGKKNLGTRVREREREVAMGFICYLVPLAGAKCIYL